MSWELLYNKLVTERVALVGEYKGYRVYKTKELV